MNKICGILVGHGEYPYAVYRTIESILGSQRNFEIISNQNCSSVQIQQQIEGVIKKYPNFAIIIFADLLGGSCGIVSQKIIKSSKNNLNGDVTDKREIALIGPVHLSMLIKFFQYREKLSFQELVNLLLQASRDEIRIVTPDF
ncbi:MAG: hypothetical protein ABIK33_03550 [candidate division WOR-3 bacterium]